MSIVSEFEQVPLSTRQEIPADQPETDRDLVKKINDLLNRSKRHRKRYDADWNYNYEFVCSGRQWSIDRPRWRFGEVVNVLWSTIMTEIALQTDGKPKAEFSSAEPNDAAFTDILSEVHQSNWEKYKWSSVISGLLFHSKLYHAAHAEVVWDPDMNSGLGDVCFRELDPFYCYVDPRASDVNKGRKARWFIYAEPRPTSELKLKYPDKKDKIKADISLLNQHQDSTQTGRIYTNFDPYSPSRLPSSATATGEVYGGEPHTVLIRAWLRDDTLEEICEEKDNEAGEKSKEYILRKKYPTGRYIEICNNELLFDGPPGVEIQGNWVPYEDDAFPVARLVNYNMPLEYYGENECTHTKGPQKLVNYIWSYIMDMFRTQANPITVIGTGANVDEEEVTNEPGSIVHADDVNQFKREQGVPVTPGSFDLLGQALANFDKVQGMQDVQRGADVSNATSGLMLEGYLEAAQTRPRLKNRNLDDFLQDVGELILKRMLQFYTQPRVYRIVNKLGFPEFVEFYVPELQDANGKTSRVARIKRVSTLPNGQTLTDQTEVDVKGLPDVRITSGSALPYAKAQKAQTALTYFNAGAIDTEELLKSVDWPNFEEVIKRMAQNPPQQPQR
jgi:hypothetical protein